MLPPAAPLQLLQLAPAPETSRSAIVMVPALMLPPLACREMLRLLANKVTPGALMLPPPAVVPVTEALLPLRVEVTPAARVILPAPLMLEVSIEVPPPGPVRFPPDSMA